jgi:hypothetical protein
MRTQLKFNERLLNYKNETIVVTTDDVVTCQLLMKYIVRVVRGWRCYPVAWSIWAILSPISHTSSVANTFTGQHLSLLRHSYPIDLTYYFIDLRSP